MKEILQGAFLGIIFLVFVFGGVYVWASLKFGSVLSGS